MNATYHLTFEQDTRIYWYNYAFRSDLSLISIYALSRVTTYSLREIRDREKVTQTNAQLFTSLRSIVFGSNIEDRWRKRSH